MRGAEGARYLANLLVGYGSFEPSELVESGNGRCGGDPRLLVACVHSSATAFVHCVRHMMGAGSESTIK